MCVSSVFDWDTGVGRTIVLLHQLWPSRHNNKPEDIIFAHVPGENKSMFSTINCEHLCAPPAHNNSAGKGH